MGNIHEQLSEQFYRWEQRGRGWQVFDTPVYPEPPFQPFYGHFLPDTPVVDDGRRPSFLSSLAKKMLAPKVEPNLPAISEEEEPQPTALFREKTIELQTSLPSKLDISREAFDQFLSNLSLCREPIAFELLGSHQRVVAQFAASETDVSQVRRQLQAHFPEATFLPRAGTLDEVWEACEGEQAFAVEFGLEREFMFPLASGKIDPFIGIIGALAELQPGELGLFQVLFQPVQHSWAESVVRSVTHEDGKPFFVNSPELATAAERKVQRPLFAAVVRIMARTKTRNRLIEITRDLAGSLRVFAHPQGNALIPLHNEDYPFEAHIEDILLRQTRRSGMLLNSDELFGFVHLPASAVRSPVLVRDAGKTKAAPEIVQHPPGVIIGDNEHHGETVPVILTADQRVRHTHIIGSNGTGKSSLLLNLIRQDIEHGDGIAVLDPHGDLIDSILGFIPERRIDDVVLVDLSDEDFPIGFNLLHAHSEIEKRLLASDLVGVFRRLSTTWGDQMDTVLQNAILAFLKSNQGGTLADLRRFLRDEKFRSQFLLTVQDVEVLTFWLEIFPTLGGGRSVSSLLARLQEFFSQEPLRNMVSQRVNKLDFADVMDSGKIFLAKLSTGLGGEENSYLLGTLLVSKFQQLAMARQAQKLEARRDFWLYIDEFQHFISPSMEKILTGARKYRLGFTLAHQDLHQLQDNAKVASAVMTQPCTRIVLGVGDDDAKKLAEGFTSFDAQCLKTLEKFHAIARVERNDFDFNLALRKPESSTGGEERKAAVIAASRVKYATPRADVEAALLAEIRPDAGKTKPPVSAGEGIKPTSKPVIPPPPPVPSVVPKAPTETTGSEKKALEAPKPVEPPPVKKVSLAETELKSGTHTSIKDDIGKEAEILDYTVSYEELFPEVQGRADIVLRRGSQTIVGQVTVETPAEYEVNSIRKFLQTSSTHIAVICVNRKKLDLIEQTLGDVGSQTARVGFYSPQEFISKLYGWAADDPEGGSLERGKLRKQSISLASGTLTEAERKQKELALLAVIKERMQR